MNKEYVTTIIATGMLVLPGTAMADSLEEIHEAELAEIRSQFDRLESEFAAEKIDPAMRARKEYIARQMLASIQAEGGISSVEVQCKAFRCVYEITFRDLTEATQRWGEVFHFFIRNERCAFSFPPLPLAIKDAEGRRTARAFVDCTPRKRVDERRLPKARTENKKGDEP